MEMITDGKGKGNKWEIDENSMGVVRATTITHEEYHSDKSNDVFVVNLALTQASGGTSEGLGYLKYTGSKKMNISRIVVASEEPSGGLTKFGIWTNPTTTSGGTTKTATNLNLSATKSSETTIYHNNDGTALTISGGDSIFTVRMEGANTYPVDFKNTLILFKDDIVAVKASAATVGTKTRANILFFEHSE